MKALARLTLVLPALLLLALPVNAEGTGVISGQILELSSKKIRAPFAVPSTRRLFVPEAKKKPAP